jgi:hypothetical protein
MKGGLLAAFFHAGDSGESGAATNDLNISIKSRKYPFSQ